MTDSDTTSSDDRDATVWLLVDHSSREAAFSAVANQLEKEGVETHVVTITEVIGNVARDAITGGAERLLRGLRVAFRGASGDEDLIGAVRRGKPDLLVVTDARYTRALGLLESLSGIATLQVGVLANYNLSSSWLKTSLQAFVVPHEEQRSALSRAGFSPERVLVAGPPIQPGFIRELDRASIREDFGFGDQKVGLVRADGFDATTLERVVFQGTLAKSDIKFIFHHDGDATAAATLRRAASKFGLKAAMFGKVDDLERFVCAADFIVAAPGEPFVAELVALDRPLLFVGAENGYEAQVSFLQNEGVADHIPDVLRLGSRLDAFIDDDALAARVEAGAALSTTDGTAKVAEALLTALDNQDAWQVPVERQPTGDDDPEPEESPTPDDSPFETIGEDDKTTIVDETGTKRDVSGLSKAEAKEELAALILTERDIERKLDEEERQQTRWRNRLELAREWNEEDLANEAEEILRGHMAEAKQLRAELDSILEQKRRLKQAARGGEPIPAGDEERDSGRIAEMENRFRKMEVDSDLESLKDRIKRELGE